MDFPHFYFYFFTKKKGKFWPDTCQKIKIQGNGISSQDNKTGLHCRIALVGKLLSQLKGTELMAPEKWFVVTHRAIPSYHQKMGARWWMQPWHWAELSDSWALLATLSRHWGTEVLMWCPLLDLASCPYFLNLLCFWDGHTTESWWGRRHVLSLRQPLHHSWQCTNSYHGIHVREFPLQ